MDLKLVRQQIHDLALSAELRLQSANLEVQVPRLDGLAVQVREVQVVARTSVAALVPLVRQEELAGQVVDRRVGVGDILHNKISNTMSCYGSGRSVHLGSSGQWTKGRAWYSITLYLGTAVSLHLQRERYDERVEKELDTI